MKMSEKERRVFLAVSTNATASIAEIAHHCGEPEHVVRHALNSLRRRSLVQTSLVVDEMALGFRHIKMLLRIEPNRGNSFDSIEKIIAVSRGVAWLARIAGEYTHYMSMYVRDYAEVERFFDSFTQRLGPVVARKLIAEKRNWTYFGKKYIDPSAPSPRPVSTGRGGCPVKVDDLDIQIVSELAKHPLAPMRDIARATGAPTSSLGYRIRKLRESGAIGPVLHRIRQQSTAFAVYMAYIQTASPSGALNESLFTFAKRHPNCVEIANCFGSWDVALGIEAEEHAEVHVVVSELYRNYRSEIHNILLVPVFADVVWAFDLRKSFAPPRVGKGELRKLG